MFELELNFDIDNNSKKTISDSIMEINEDYKSFFLKYNRAVLDGEFQRGFPKDFRTRVDGKLDADPKTVKPFGRIQYLNTTVDIVPLLRKAYDEILNRSPIGGPKGYFPGVKYRDFNWVFLNDRVVARNRLEFTRFTENFASRVRGNDKITFINVVPYARKLERFGITRSTRGTNKGQIVKKGRRTRRSPRTNNFVEIPRGTYAGAQRVIKSIFQGRATVSNVKYLPQNISVGGMRSRFSPRGRGPNQQPGRPYLYPVIDVIIDAKGFRGTLQ